MSHASGRRNPTEGLPRMLLNKYRLDRRVGEGTYGVVYKAIDLRRGDVVAIKEMRPDCEEEGFPSSALREIAILLELEHPNVVKLREVVREPDSLVLCLVFDFLDFDFHRLMEMVPALGQNTTLVKYYSWQMLCGLEYLHRRRILHRDLKPQNLLIDRAHNRLQLADFGLSRAFGVPIRHLSPEVVTLWYRAPELLLGSKTYTTAVDVWSLACIIIETVNRWPLFPGNTEVDEIHRIFGTLGTPTDETWQGMSSLPYGNRPFPMWPAKPWSVIVPGQDAAGRDLLMRMLQYDPTKRISAAAALQHPYFHDIQSILRNPPQLL